MEKAKLQERYQLFIGGQWKDASAHETFKTICPADGSVLAECAQATKEDVDEAVKAAWEAFKTWKHTTVAERACRFKIRSLPSLMKIRNIWLW